MATENEDHTVLGFFENHKYQPFEFVCVTDMDVANHPNYYKAIFRNIKKNSFHSLAIAPEYMRYKYKVGHIYTNGEHVGQNSTVLKDEFTVNSNPMQPLQPLSSILTQNEIDSIIQYKDVSKYLSRQFAHVEVQEDFTLIIPCYAIANKFYFLSSSMKKAAMTESLESLYYKGSFHPDKNDQDKTIIKLHIKKTAGKKDLPFLCRFLGSSFSKNRFEYLMSQKSFTTSDKPFQPIKAQFPIKEIFNIYASYIYVGNDTRSKPKYLVLNIHSDNSQFAFSEILYKQYSNQQDPTTMPPQNMDMPKPPPRKFKKKATKRDSKVYKGTPSSEYNLYQLRPNSDDDDYFKTKRPATYGTTIYSDLKEAEPSFDKDNKKKVGNSFEKATANGDEDLGEVAVTNDDPNETKERIVFNLSNFYQFYEALLTYASVSGSQLERPYKIDKIKNDKRRGYKSKSILNGDEKSVREFLFGELGYDGKTVYIVEIAQDESWGPSTWIFIDANNNGSYDSNTMHEIIKYYINGEQMTYEKLENHVQFKYNLIFKQQNHKNGDIDDITVERWCESILGKV